jgi:hypothetical protein
VTPNPTDLTPRTPTGGAGQTAAQDSTTVSPMTTPNWAPATHRPTSRTADITTAILTFIAAALATGVAAVGMWRFFGDIVGITDPYIRGTFFAFLEIALFVSAIRARRNLLEDLARLKAENGDTRRASTGAEGIAVWALAGLSGVFSAIDGHSWGERAFRLVAPLVAAWLWERGLAVHRRRARGVRLLRGVDWAGVVDRALVRIGLLRVSVRNATEVEQARRIAKLAALRYRIHDLGDGATLRLFRQSRVRRATRRYRVALAAANEEFGFAEDAALRELLRLNLAVLYASVEGTTPAAVAPLAPWGETAPEQGVAPVTDAVVAPAVAPATQSASRGATRPGRRGGRGRNSAAKKAPSQPATSVAVAAETDRSDEALVAIIRPLVAGATEEPSQRSMQDAIKAATRQSVGVGRLARLVEMARADDRAEPAATKVNGHVHAGVS